MKPVDSAAELLRLGDRSGSELASALRELSQRGPDATELASLATRLSLQGIAMTPPAATTAPAGAPAARGVGWKWALAGSAAILGAGSWLSLRAPTVSSPHPAQTKSAASVASASQPSGVAAERSTPGEGARQPTPAPLAPTDLSSPASAGPTSTASPSLEAGKPAQPASGVTPLPSQVTEALPGNPAQRKRSADATQRSAATATATEASATEASATEASATDPALPSELEILRGARLALKGSPAEALRLAEQHRGSYPAGKLTQERELIAISALLALGRRTAALSRAASFERAFPASPYRKQIGELLQ